MTRTEGANTFRGGETLAHEMCLCTPQICTYFVKESLGCLLEDVPNQIKLSVSSQPRRGFKQIYLLFEGGGYAMWNKIKDGEGFGLFSVASYFIRRILGIHMHEKRTVRIYVKITPQ